MGIIAVVATEYYYLPPIAIRVGGTVKAWDVAIQWISKK